MCVNEWKHWWVNIPAYAPFVLWLLYYGPNSVFYYGTKMTERVKRAVKLITFSMKKIPWHGVGREGIYLSFASSWFCNHGQDPFLSFYSVSPFEKWVTWTRWALTNELWGPFKPPLADLQHKFCKYENMSYRLQIGLSHKSQHRLALWILLPGNLSVLEHFLPKKGGDRHWSMSLLS